ncbi:MAG TPA: threonine--tRNA ligase [Ignisphaera aggregans]|uniref:Threonine--tRNA ligase n=1 Tax=Ignisphaera aggregans TaxID=334771 RepID=A0A833DUJ4_9CREN|nr:threonine--tRNA ligase [Ignisphaera aggregans]
MRLLLIHAEKFRYRVVQKAIDSAEAIDETRKSGLFTNALIVFTSIEEQDEKNIEEVVKEAANEIMNVKDKVKASTVVIYPYAHLSPNLASPSIAMKALELLEHELKLRGIEVHRAPFGWYKEFELHCYGHPLSELSRTIRPVSEKKRVIEKKYFILTPRGELIKPEEYKFGENENEFRLLVEKEVFRKEIEGGQGRVYYYLRKFGFEWESSSDHGHMRYEPHATVMVEAVAAYSWRVATSLGIPVFRVRGTNMFSLDLEPVRQHAELFGERMYEVRMDGDRFVLRFAACHQQFAILKDWVLSYKDLPLGMFEVADSYRYEQRGELVLGFRLRRFHMPDLHILTRDLEEAKSIAMKVRDKIVEEAKKLGREYQAIYNVTEDFLKEHFDYLVELVKREGKPVLVAVYPAGIYYWVINVEYVIIDELGRPREIATWQIDVGNARRFGIRYRDEKGEERYPVIIHTAILGSIERYIYMVFDTAARDEAQGKAPTLPTWLSPIQVRVIPVSRAHVDYAISIAKTLERHGIRVDVDDRDESLGRKIRDAGIEWIPYVVVVGDREVKTNTVNVRIRKTGVQKSMRLEELIELLEKELEGYPRVESALPLLMSKRPPLHYLQPLERSESERR